MAVSFSCHCPERSKPVTERNWVVLQRMCHHSAFNGYRKTFSEYSTVHCRACNACGRTKAKWVTSIKDEETTCK